MAMAEGTVRRGRGRREVEFSQPVRQIALMVAALAAVSAIGWFLYDPIRTVFEANAYLNGLIAGVFVIGVLATFVSALRLVAAVSWIEGFASNRVGHEFAEPPTLLASLSALLRDDRARAALGASSARTILDSIALRLDESRDITRYIASLLIFLGLLGTFWGLSNTVPAVVDTIRSLAPDEGGGTAADAFDRLMSGLEDQLGGMGTAFASSLLGLAGSLVVGLLELFAGHAQNRFYRELEEWLSSITRIGYGGDGESGGLGATLVEQNALQIETLARLAERGDEKRAAFEARVAELTEAVSRLAAQTGAAHARTQGDDGAAAQRQIALLERIAARLERPEPPSDDFEGDPETRARIRNIDRQLLRLLEEIAQGRQDAVAELRAELSLLGRAVVELADRLGARR
ncbi:MAG: biopolymer transporter ExbB [Rubrimonas sp.]|uniref:biopolymer transporter ExbB n=1 Tax=Rubrimonas sp. TaxID=2036015 RepID=UPI002FDDCE11